MIRNFLATGVAAPILLIVGGCLHAPMLWSPDGRWLAYTVEVRPIEGTLRPGWLFDSPTATPPGPTATARPTAYRLWATRADSGASVLLEESAWPLTAPGWSPNGRALAFGRVFAEANGAGRLEVVVLEGPGRRRVLSSRTMPEVGVEAAQLPGQAIAWSPDGRHLAVPQLSPPGLAILRADTGRQVNSIGDGFLPAWAPDSSRLAFFLRGTVDTLHCVDSPAGSPRLLAEVGLAGQAPAWARDGQSVLVVARRALPRGAEPPGDQAELIKVHVETGQASTIKALSGDGILGRDRAVQGVSIALDAEGENLFCSTVVEGMPRQITWYRPKEDAVYKKFSIVDFTASMGSLSLSPDGRTLAARVGAIDRITAPALCDLESPDLRARLVAPDDASRVEWIATLVGSARGILAALPLASPEPGAPAGGRLDRPSLLPVLGEFEPNSELTFRLRRIGKLGRPLCDRPAQAPTADPSVASLLDEARFFFEYLAEDYPAALESLEALEGRAQTPDHRARLLAVRAQIFIAQAKVDRATRTLDYLRALDRKPGRRVEWDGSRYAMAGPDRPDGRGWLDYLAWRATGAQALLQGENLDSPFNPDGPRPGLGLAPGEPRLNALFPDRPFLDEPALPRAPADRGNGIPRPGTTREGPAGMPRR